MHHRLYIRHLAQFDGLPMQRQLQLNRIADVLLQAETLNMGKPVACTLEEAIRVAYNVFKSLWHAQVSH